MEKQISRKELAKKAREVCKQFEQADLGVCPHTGVLLSLSFERKVRKVRKTGTGCFLVVNADKAAKAARDRGVAAMYAIREIVNTVVGKVRDTEAICGIAGPTVLVFLKRAPIKGGIKAAARVRAAIQALPNYADGSVDVGAAMSFQEAEALAGEAITFVNL